MEYLIGKSKSLGSSHRDDRGTSLRVVSAGSRHYLILDGGLTEIGMDGGINGVAVVRLEGIAREVLSDAPTATPLVLFMAALEDPSQYDERLCIQLGDNDWLTVYSSNRGDPYREGVTITVGARPYSEDTGARVSVFVEDADVRRLWVALGGVEEDEQ